VQHDSQWQQFISRMADIEEQENRRRRHEHIGRKLWLVIWTATTTAALGLLMKYMGWL
jgi:hypothetical protein